MSSVHVLKTVVTPPCLDIDNPKPRDIDNVIPYTFSRQTVTPPSFDIDNPKPRDICHLLH